MRASLLLAILGLAVSWALDEPCAGLLAKVNVFVGTGGLAYGYGSLNPAAQYPHGGMRLGPDTADSALDISWRHFSGYNSDDDQIRAFSHTHLVGAGIDNLGHFGVMPTRGMTKPLSWWSPFSKSREKASPGRYSVFLDKPRVQVDLQATSRFTALHRYKWEEGHEESNRFEMLEFAALNGQAGLIFDVCHSAKLQPGLVNGNEICHNATLSIGADGKSFTAEALLNDDARAFIYGSIVMVDSPSFLSPPLHWYTCTDPFKCNKQDAGSSVTSSKILYSRVSGFGNGHGGGGPEVELHVGLSFISADMAKQNLLSLADGRDEVDPVWCKELENLSVTPLDSEDSSADTLVLMHTFNYHSRMSPTNLVESGGVYKGLDGQLHTTSSQEYYFYSDLSLWDTFRTQHPWLLLTNEPLAADVLRSLSAMTLQQGGFPKWVLMSKDIGCMVGLHGAAAVVEAMAIPAIANDLAPDALAIQKALLLQSLGNYSGVNPRTDAQGYLDRGYVSSESSDVATSLTMTYAYDDFLLARLSQIVGDDATAEAAQRRSSNAVLSVWRRDGEDDKDHLDGGAMGFICPRNAAGAWDCPPSATSAAAWKENIEGDAFHWGLFWTQDPAILIPKLFPSQQVFVQQLESYFVQHVAAHEKLGSAVPNPYYWAGNEISAFTPFLFAYSSFPGACMRTQYWSRRLTYLHYSNLPHGLPGNDDYGSMSTWFLFASLGIFPRAGTNDFVLASPRVQSATIHLKKYSGGKQQQLKITAHDNSADNVYVLRALFNGKELKSAIIDRAVLLQGGELEFFMGAEKTTTQSQLCP